jgi:hypothetical protein
VATTTNFDHWLDANCPQTQDEKADLINSVRNVSKMGEYTTTRNGDKFLVTGWTADSLLLASEKARWAFVERVTRIQVPDDLDEEYRRKNNDPNT